MSPAPLVLPWRDRLRAEMRGATSERVKELANDLKPRRREWFYAHVVSSAPSPAFAADATSQAAWTDSEGCLTRFSKAVAKRALKDRPEFIAHCLAHSLPEESTVLALWRHILLKFPPPERLAAVEQELSRYVSKEALDRRRLQLAKEETLWRAALRSGRPLAGILEQFPEASSEGIPRAIVRAMSVPSTTLLSPQSFSEALLFISPRQRVGILTEEGPGTEGGILINLLKEGRWKHAEEGLRALQNDAPDQLVSILHQAANEVLKGSATGAVLEQLQRLTVEYGQLTLEQISCSQPLLHRLLDRPLAHDLDPAVVSWAAEQWGLVPSDEGESALHPIARRLKAARKQTRLGKTLLQAWITLERRGLSPDHHLGGPSALELVAGSIWKVELTKMRQQLVLEHLVKVPDGAKRGRIRL